jgi:hypothetical protein
MAVEQISIHIGKSKIDIRVALKRRLEFINDMTILYRVDFKITTGAGMTKNRFFDHK